MEITNKWLDKWYACSEGREYFAKVEISDPVKLANKLIDNHYLDWCNWMIARLLNRENHIRYACYAAKQVLHIFEEKYPDDKRLRAAINAARKCVEDKTAATRAAHAAAAWAALVPAWAAARAAMKTKILRYGIILLKKQVA